MIIIIQNNERHQPNEELCGTTIYALKQCIFIINILIPFHSIAEKQNIDQDYIKSDKSMDLK